MHLSWTKSNGGQSSARLQAFIARCCCSDTDHVKVPRTKQTKVSVEHTNIEDHENLRSMPVLDVVTCMEIFFKENIWATLASK